MNKKLKHWVLGIPALALLCSSAMGEELKPAAKLKIREIVAEKRNFTAGEQKMTSDLIFSAKAARGELVGRAFAAAAPKAKVNAAGKVVVDIQTVQGAVASVVQLVSAAGGKVISQYPAYNAVRASLPLLAVENLAASHWIKSVSSEQKFKTRVGALTSQGYVSHAAKPVVERAAIDGSGVKVGVLSDSASAARVAALKASGDLGTNTTVLPGQEGPESGADEGTAMMEIIQDIAPGAQLYFATAEGGEAAFASNITALAAAGCVIIVDDVSYYSESAFQDGPIAQAVNAFALGGGLYFSATGNEGNLTSGTSGTWEGDFVDGGDVTAPITDIDSTGRLHDFGAQTYNVLTSQGSVLILQWSDPWGASTNDYDLFVLDSTGGTVKSYSTNAQTGTQNPGEFVFPEAGDRIVIVKYTGDARALRLSTHGGQLSIATAGAAYDHSVTLGSLGIAATFWNSAKTGVKPFTGAANPIEKFSSDGPRKHFYNADGTAITPGNVLFATNGGITHAKPDFTAADGVSTKTPAFLPFYGTSAAAPHAAAIAALVKHARPDYTRSQIIAALQATALDNMSGGWDRDGGYGVLSAQAAVNYALTH